MLLKFSVIVLFLGIIYCLGSATFYMMRDGAASRKMAWMLTWRIILSLICIGLLIAGFYGHWITPHPLPIKGMTY